VVISRVTAADREGGRRDRQMKKRALKDTDDGTFGGQIGNKLATALPLRPQRDDKVNRCRIAVSSFGPLVFQRRPRLTRSGGPKCIRRLD